MTRGSVVLVRLDFIDAPHVIRIGAGLQLMKMRSVHSEITGADTDLVRGALCTERRAEHMDAPALADTIKHGADRSSLRQMVGHVDLDGCSCSSKLAVTKRHWTDLLLNHDTHSQPNRNANQLAQTGVVAC